MNQQADYVEFTWLLVGSEAENILNPMILWTFSRRLPILIGKGILLLYGCVDDSIHNTRFIISDWYQFLG